LQQTSPAVVDELIPGQMKLGEVQQVLQMMLREQVSIRQLAVILETLGDYAGRTNDPIWLTEYVRHRLARTICTRYRDAEKRVFVVTMDPAMEERIQAGVEHNDRGLFVRMSPEAIETTCKTITDSIGKLTRENHRPILLVSPQIRPSVKQITSAHMPNLIVLSYNEITRDTRIESLGMVSDTVPA
jgi:flagellar biosynthesis protein FlhA